MRIKKFVSSPWIFVPMLFIVVGAGGRGLVGNLTAVMFKDFGFSNVLLGAVALLSLPSSFRFLWAPWINSLGNKRELCRQFIELMALTVFILSRLTVFGMLTPFITFIIIGIFALLFTCLEVASDRYYIRIFTPELQAEFVGIKTAAIRGGIILSIVLFIRLAGDLQEKGWQKNTAWAAALAAAGADTLTAWIADAGATDLTQVLSVSAETASSGADLGKFIVQGQGGSDATTASGVALDEFRFGTSMLDVCAVPERGTIGLFLISGSFSFLVRRLNHH
ncbi:MAG: hypothetical protein WC958_05825 [Dehalococcoidales bacterium]